MLNEILELAHKISAEKKADVFVRYSGHICGLEIGIYVDGWKIGAGEDISKSINMKRMTDFDRTGLTDTLNILRAIYADQPLVIEMGRCDLCKRRIFTGERSAPFKSLIICGECADELKDNIVAVRAPA